MGLIEQMRAGDRRALSRLVSIVENGGDDARRALARLYQYTGHAHIIGVTGPPGAGKSTLVNELALEYRRRGQSVAVLAVDPTSPFSGGAILGDRIRMQPLGNDPSIFVRSMASRGQLGGLARATADVIKVLDAAGFDKIIVETVGAGQAEVEIAREAHTTVVVEVPGLGDDVQAIKAGILEIADVFVVNKADREDAARTKRHLQQMMQLGSEPREGWEVPVLMTVATRGQGIGAVVDAIEQHLEHLRRDGYFAVRERQRIVSEFEGLLRSLALDLVRERVSPEQREAIVDQIQARTVDPYTAAERMLADALGVRAPA
ncbi:methylmalonyl Co-A mutase-associated GTPase MeaB [Kallotenue papyrolyticum]|uniref:methylmalonyl Co-A mutase-associated GTPase MeaB n=1 Tax=Kallotenue papyrolyticum TaxID=1325125 RepID=UPI00049297C8|nr:methylmalonyl Co-A mutase-associated GTPase MeaB [Kallotenue papyrolyticum]